MDTNEDIRIHLLRDEVIAAADCLYGVIVNKRMLLEGFHAFEMLSSYALLAEGHFYERTEELLDELFEHRFFKDAYQWRKKNVKLMDPEEYRKMKVFPVLKSLQRTVGELLPLVYQKHLTYIAIREIGAEYSFGIPMDLIPKATDEELEISRSTIDILFCIIDAKSINFWKKIFKNRR